MTFDAIYEYDPTNLFNEIVLKVMDRVDFDTKLLHADTTSFGVHGMYEDEDIGNTIEITLGHPKDGRADLKQFVLSMVTNQHGLPLFVEAKSGNASDKNTIIDTDDSKQYASLTPSQLQRGANIEPGAMHLVDTWLSNFGISRGIGGLQWINSRTRATAKAALALVQANGDALLAHLQAQGVLATGLIGLRFVTHLDVDRAGIERTIAAIRGFFEDH